MTAPASAADIGRLLNALLARLDVDTERRTYARTDALRATAVPRNPGDDRRDVDVHIQPNLAGLSPAGWCLELADGDRQIHVELNRAGQARLRQLPPGHYSVRAVPAGSEASVPRTTVLDTIAGIWERFFAPQSLAVNPAATFSTARSDSMFYRWQDERGGKCYLHQDAGGPLLFSIDVEQASAPDEPIRYALVDGQSGEEALASWLMPHPDPHNDGHQVASATVPHGPAIPSSCAIAVMPRGSGGAALDLDAIRAAVESAVGEGDRDAWDRWIQRECDAGRLDPSMRDLAK
jgi:hypothetical protein